VYTHFLTVPAKSTKSPHLIGALLGAFAFPCRSMGTSLKKSFNTEFPIGSWFISFGSHEEITLYGPYESMDFCMKLGLEMLPTITFTFPNEMI
jgi:hypothetical protein